MVKTKEQIMSGIAFILIGIENLFFSIKALTDGALVNDFFGIFYWKTVGFFIVGFSVLMCGIFFLISDTKQKRGNNNSSKH